MPHCSGLTERFRRARRDPDRAVLEGFHALKHALRFGASVEQVVTRDLSTLLALTESLAPDIEPYLRATAEVVSASTFEALAPSPPDTGVIALAGRPRHELSKVLGSPGPAPILLLEAPARLGNLGAAIRAAAAAGAAAVLSIGHHDPWQPTALRGAAGLHFALPVMRIDAVPRTARPLLAIEPAGEPIGTLAIPDRALLAFGTERRGLSTSLARAADRRIAIPMQPGVSSLNLASAVAVALYNWRLGQA